MRMYTAQTMTELHETLCQALVFSPADQLDLVTSVDCQIHNSVARAESMVWDFDLKDMWLTKSRWSMMARQYIDPNEFQAWIEKTAKMIGPRGRGNSVLRTKVVKPRGGGDAGNKETRRWGSCMISITYKALPSPQITLHSRTSYIGYLGGMDMTIAWMAGRYLAAAMDIPLESISFVWFNEMMQFHNFKCLAYLLNHPDPKLQKSFRRMMMKPESKLKPKEIEALAKYPALGMSRKWLATIIEQDRTGHHLGMMSYNTYRRIRRRFHTEVLGYEKAKEFEGWSVHKTGPNKGENKEFFAAYKPLDSVRIKELDFSPIGLPLAGVTPLDYDMGVDEADLHDCSNLECEGC